MVPVLRAMGWSAFHVALLLAAFLGLVGIRPPIARLATHGGSAPFALAWLIAVTIAATAWTLHRGVDAPRALPRRALLPGAVAGAAFAAGLSLGSALGLGSLLGGPFAFAYVLAWMAWGAPFGALAAYGLAVVDAAALALLRRGRAALRQRA